MKEERNDLDIAVMGLKDLRAWLGQGRGTEWGEIVLRVAKLRPDLVEALIDNMTQRRALLSYRENAETLKGFGVVVTDAAAGYPVERRGHGRIE